MAEKDSKTETKNPMLDPSTVEAFKLLIQEMKRDPEADARKKQEEEQRRHYAENERQFREMQKQGQQMCPHKKEDGKWAIAWAPYADDKPRGVCQHCNMPIDPSHEQYEFFLKHTTLGFTLSYPKG